MLREKERVFIAAEVFIAGLERRGERGCGLGCDIFSASVEWRREREERELCVKEREKEGGLFLRVAVKEGRLEGGREGEREEERE